MARLPQPAPGRPGPGRDKRVKQRLLTASQRLFADHGYQGVSVKSIAAKAGVNSAMVHYYFGNKQGLFTAVIEETLHPVLGKIQELATVTETESFIEQFLQIYMKTLAANPWFPILLTREVILPEGRLREPFLRQVVSPVSAKIRELVAARKSQGKLGDEVDPVLATINLISLAAFPFLAKSVLSKALKIEFSDSFVERLSRHTARLYLDGIHGTGEPR